MNEWKNKNYIFKHQNSMFYQNENMDYPNKNKYYGRVLKNLKYQPCHWYSSMHLEV